MHMILISMICNIFKSILFLKELYLTIELFRSDNHTFKNIFLHYIYLIDK